MRVNRNRKTVLLADGLCLLVAGIWGTGFIGSQIAINANMSAALIMMMRFTVAAIVMLVVCLPKLKKIRKQDVKSGILAGLFLFGGFYTQILGQQRTTVSHCAFFTATNVVMVPFIMWAVSRRRPAIRTFLLTAVTLVGISVLSITPGSFALTFNFGDAMSLLCALLFALHISSLGRISEDADVTLINLVQMATAAVISIIVFVLTDFDAFYRADMKVGFPAVIYLGLICTCLCFFLQTLAQKYTTPAQAGVLLSCEGLFGSVLSVALGMEKATINMVAGGLIILTSVVLMEFLGTQSPKNGNQKMDPVDQK